ncbi:ABC transporter permease [Dokdonella sp.]|uniref:ABC transporter permease n=1 Tax=Dokdonella sp. TaxID=2291710 RepID=UPI0027BABC56|nr:ABC transporter permease [Dokdonella sp.]
MSTAIAVPALASSPPVPRLLRCYALEARHEFLRLLRTPMFALPTLLFPAMFYVLFASLTNGSASGPINPAVYMLAGYTVFGVMAPGMFGFGVAVATDRDSGWLRWRRASPMPPAAYLAAKLVMAMLFAALVYATMAAAAVIVGGVRMAWSAWGALALVASLGVVPFCAIGLFVGSLCRAQAAPAIVNLIYLPMAFLSGLWLPLMLLPALLREAAPVWPSYHLAQLAYAATAQPHAGSLLGHVAVLAGMTALFLLLAWRRLARA